MSTEHPVFYPPLKSELRSWPWPTMLRLKVTSSSRQSPVPCGWRARCGYASGDTDSQASLELPPNRIDIDSFAPPRRPPGSDAIVTRLAPSSSSSVLLLSEVFGRCWRARNLRAVAFPNRRTGGWSGRAIPAWRATAPCRGRRAAAAMMADGKRPPRLDRKAAEQAMSGSGGRPRVLNRSTSTNRDIRGWKFVIWYTKVWT